MRPVELPRGSRGRATLHSALALPQAIVLGAELPDAPPHISIRVEGAPVAGIVVELSGPALDLLDIEALVGSRGHASDDAPPRRLRVAPERQADGAQVFRFPDAELTPAPPVTPAAPGPEGVRAVDAHYDALARATFEVVLRGRPRRAGEGALHVRASSAGAAPTSASGQIRARAPTGPTMLAPSAAMASPMFAGVRTGWQRAYEGRTHLAGWIGLDAPFRDRRDLVLAMADNLLDAAQAPSLRVTTASEGVQRTLDRRWTRGDTLLDPKWSELANLLSAEALVQLEAEAGGAVVALVYQPDGNPRTDRRVRAAMQTEAQPVPIEIAWVLPAPPGAQRAALVGRLRALVERAAADRACVGAFAAASGLPCEPLGLMPYELLVGTAAARGSKAWAATHARAPGFAVLVPEGAGVVDAPPGAAIRVTRAPAGWLVGLDDADAFAASNAAPWAAMERVIAPRAGTGPEALAHMEALARR